MKKHLIESQRVAKGETFANGFTTGKRENVDRPGHRKTVVVNVTPEMNCYTATVYTTTPARTILSKNLNRRYLLIQNVGATTVYLGLGSTPSVNGNDAVELPPGVQISFESGYCPNNEISAISATQGKLSIVEGVINV